jgi:hypothetical protein
LSKTRRSGVGQLRASAYATAKIATLRNTVMRGRSMHDVCETATTKARGPTAATLVVADAASRGPARGMRTMRPVTASGTRGALRLTALRV